MQCSHSVMCDGSWVKVRPRWQIWDVSDGRGGTKDGKGDGEGKGVGGRGRHVGWAVTRQRQNESTTL